jgi:Arc/MetJ family transcription regulator
MRTTVHIDDDLMDRIVQVGGFKTKREAIITAMEEYVRRRDRETFAELRGTIAFEDDHLDRIDALERGEHP